MAKQRKQPIIRRSIAALLTAYYGVCGIPGARGYAFNEIVPDVRQPASISGGSACPVPSHHLIAPGSIAEQWSTVLGTNPVTIRTQDQTAAGRLNEIEQAITQSIAAWTGVSGTTLVPGTFAPVTRTAAQNACGSDGVNSICLDQADGAFTPGILAFTRVITADIIGARVGSGVAATQVGQILDADIYFDPSSSTITFATPAALAAAPTSYDFESLLIHELGHTLGFSHSAVFAAMMYPFAPAPGTFSGSRPTAQKSDAPLGDDESNRVASFVSRSWRYCKCGCGQRTHTPGQSALSTVIATRRDGDFRRACGGRGLSDRCGDRSDARRMELRGTRPRTIRWIL